MNTLRITSLLTIGFLEVTLLITHLWWGIIALPFVISTAICVGVTK